VLAAPQWSPENIDNLFHCIDITREFVEARAKQLSDEMVAEMQELSPEEIEALPAAKLHVPLRMSSMNPASASGKSRLAKSCQEIGGEGVQIERLKTTNRVSGGSSSLRSRTRVCLEMARSSACAIFIRRPVMGTLHSRLASVRKVHNVHLP
jgi:hypothetical protein